MHPNEGTNTFGRGGIIMHGGKKPGSAGCIDVGSGDKDLFPRLQSVPGIIPVIVTGSKK
jgi:hypothetical protein